MLIPHRSQSHPAICYFPNLPSWLWMGTSFVQPFQYFPSAVCTGNARLTEKKKRLLVEKLTVTKQECWHIIANAWAFSGWLSDLGQSSQG